MTRHSFLGILFGSAIAGRAQEKALKQKKYYITGLFHDKQHNDCTVPPIVSYGTSRLDALVNTRCTVWTEDEWLAGPSKDGFPPTWCPGVQSKEK